MNSKEIKSRWLYLLLTFVALISIITIKFIWNDTPEFFSLGSEIGDVLFNLSVSYLAAFMFYVIQIWIPEVKEQKSVKQRIAIPLSRLLSRMKSPIKETIKLYGRDNVRFEDISELQFLEIVRKTDLSQDDGWILSPHSGTYLKYGECLHKNIKETEEYIKQVMTMPFKLDTDLLVLLDEIQDCTYHNIINMISSTLGLRVVTLKLPDGQQVVKSTTGESIDKEFYEYYQLFFKLKAYMKDNDIPITVGGL